MFNDETMYGSYVTRYAVGSPMIRGVNRLLYSLHFPEHNDAFYNINILLPHISSGATDTNNSAG